jgi:hypothetical protein
MATATKTLVDIRETLPVATKGGTSSKPIWTIDGKTFSFAKPLTKYGRNADGSKAKLGTTGIMAKYKAGVTAAKADLMFVGIFRPLKVAKVAEKTAE